jgi:regulator of RNase E activity RraA
MNIELVRQLSEFSTTTVATAVSLLNLRDPSTGYTGPDTQALMPEWGTRIGMAVTARFDSTTPGFDTPPDRLADWVALINEAASGCGKETLPVFAVVEAVGPKPRNTVMGPMIAAQIKLAGAVGLITNGCLRDLNRLRELGLACWANGLAPMHGRMRWLDLNCAVVIDGMTVNPGDCIHADVNGAVVFPASAIDQVHEKAVAIRERDKTFYRTMAEPGALRTLLDGRKKSI